MIRSLKNPRIVRLRKLDQRKHRRAEGCFLIEGAELLELALAAGSAPRELFWCPEAPDAADTESLRARVLAAGAEPVAVSPQVLASLTRRDPRSGPVATCAIPERGLDDLDIAAHDLVVVADGLQDPGNLGTLIRTADAAGAAALVLCTPAVDPWDPKTVRGSAGSVFHIPLAEIADRSALMEWLAARGLRRVGAAPRRGEAWGDAALAGGVALLLGHETRGLSPELDAAVDAWVHLPIAGRAESLNVAVAGSILMYRWLHLR